MDQSPEAQPTDLIKGINDTPTILNHKLKTKSISVDRDFGNRFTESQSGDWRNQSGLGQISLIMPLMRWSKMDSLKLEFSKSQVVSMLK